MTTLLDQLKGIVGERGWTTDPAALEPHLSEWRGVARGATRIMLAPSSTAQVAEILRSCSRARVGVVPQGGNTGLCAGAIPDASGDQVLLSLSRLNAIRDIDAGDFSMVVEAGCILANIQQAALDVGRYFPLSLAAEGSCQIGGNLSTNAGGIGVIRYGTAREQVLGLEVVLADGTVWHGLRALRKDTAGFDLKQLFVGSEGTLGIITAATLRLYPPPGEITTALVAMRTAEDAVQLLGRMQDRLGDRVHAFELMSSRAIDFVARHIPGAIRPFDTDYPWYVLVDAAIGADPAALEGALADAIEDDVAVDAILAKSSAEADAFWRLRHSISEAQKHEGASLKHDIAVPIGKIAVLLQRGQALVADFDPGARLVAFGHVGDGNVHFNVSQPEDAAESEFQTRGGQLTEAVYALVTELGGTISAEHGIGTLKKAALERHRDAVELGLMRTLKRALDPHSILNPGKVI